MAASWIKICEDIETCRETVLIAELLGQDERLVVGHLVVFWLWCDRETADGKLPGITTKLIDKIVKVDGFADALLNENVNWLTTYKGGLKLVKYEKHHSQAAKRRSMESAKKARQRKKDGAQAGQERDRSGTNVPISPGQSGGPEYSHSHSESLSGTSDSEGECEGGMPAATWLEIWHAYPAHKRTEQHKAQRAYSDAIEEGANPAVILAGVREYAASPTGQSQYAYGITRFIEGGCWTDERASWQDDGKGGDAPSRPLEEILT